MFSVYLQYRMQAPPPPPRPTSYPTYQPPPNFRSYSPVVTRYYQPPGNLMPDAPPRGYPLQATQPEYMYPDAQQVCQMPAPQQVMQQRVCQVPVNQQQVCQLQVTQQGNMCPDPPVCKMPASQQVCQMPETQQICKLPDSQQVCQLPSRPAYCTPNQPRSVPGFSQPSLYNPVPTAFGLNAIGKPSGRPASRDNPDMFNRLPWKPGTPSQPGQSLPQYFDVTVPVMVNRPRLALVKLQFLAQSFIAKNFLN